MSVKEKIIANLKGYSKIIIYDRIPNSMIAKTISYVQKSFYYILLAAVVVFLWFKFDEIKYTLQLFSKGGPIWIFLAIITQIFTYLCNAYTYEGILKIFKLEKVLTTRELMESSIVMLFLSKIIPSLGISNNWFFVSILHKKGIVPKQGLQVVVLEVFTYYASLIILMLAGLFYLATTHNVTRFLFWGTIVGIVLVIVITVLVGWLLGNHDQLHKTIAWLKRNFAKFSGNKDESMLHSKDLQENDIESAIDVLKSKIKYLFWPTFWQVAMFILNSFTIYFLFRSFHANQTFGTAMVGFVLAQVLSLVSLIPSGIGIFEGSMVFFYTALGVPLEMAVIITILFRGLSMFAPIPIGSYLYKKLCSSKELDCCKKI
ncbi:MAG: hypothetical protein UT33_C0011G0201 [Candidatus Peregrinibacteria bacterium GW2011_GWC2_39_14]|nr:MAG: hypothetical protein UT33_C0011G0201 [Candidatus Peregrinibacteria bacterium GW2011_GWC2_39_14]